MRAYELLKEARENPTTVYDNGQGETLYVEDRGPKYHLMGTDIRYYGWSDKYDMGWNSEEEMMAWLEKNGFHAVGWESAKEKGSGLVEDIDDLIAGYDHPESSEGDVDQGANIEFSNGIYVAYLDSYHFSEPTLEAMVAQLKKLGFTHRSFGEDLFGQVENESI